LKGGVNSDKSYKHVSRKKRRGEVKQINKKNHKEKGVQKDFQQNLKKKKGL